MAASDFVVVAAIVIQECHLKEVHSHFLCFSQHKRHLNRTNKHRIVFETSKKHKLTFGDIIKIDVSFPVGRLGINNGSIVQCIQLNSILSYAHFVVSLST